MYTINNLVALARKKEAEVELGNKRKREDSSSNSTSVNDDEVNDSSKSTPKKKTNKKAKKSRMPDTQSPIQQTMKEEVSDTIEYPYEVNDDDHCETPACAYEHLVPILMKVAHVLGKTPSSLKIYDPYYCEGAVVARLAGLGFHSVYNKKEDFYQKIDTNTVPEYDCLVTNPPYSADHMEKLLKFCAQSTMPFFLLLPNYVYMKPYCLQLFLGQRSSSLPSSSSSFDNSSSSSRGMFFVTTKTHQRYLYTTPKGRRQKKSGKYTAPFPTFWYCGKQSITASKALGLALKDDNIQRNGPILICQDMQQLPIEVLCDEDPRKKKLKNAQKRKKNKLRKKQSSS